MISLFLSGPNADAQTGAAERQAFLRGQGPEDPVELGAFLDGLLEVYMKVRHIPGATVSILKDGKIFFAKGYGYADVEKKDPVLPERTLFRIASVSKLFTWTAVMQLVEQGKLDLKADVNTYLKDFKIPATFPEPVTLANLMTHSAGFEDILTYSARTPEGLISLGDFVKSKMPTRVWPPGQYTAYSNYSTALAGYIVQEISGVPFLDYIEQHIYKPLGMEHSSFREPLPSALADDVSVGYSYQDGAFKAEAFELLNGDYPAGSMSTTATDIARFMIAHLQNGQYEGQRILQEETAREMHRRLFSHDPRLNGNAHGFWERSLNGLTILEHGGDIKCFHTILALIPERNAGFFLSFNCSTSSSVTAEEAFQAFLNRYYPAPSLSEFKPNPEFKARSYKYAGVYEMNRRSFTKFPKLVTLITPVKMETTSDGALRMILPAGLGSTRWAEVGPNIFRQVGGQETLIFREDSRGRVTHAFSSEFAEFALVKLKGYQTPGFHILLIAILTILFLTAILGWPLGALSRSLLRRPPVGRPAPGAARWLAGGMCLLFLLLILGVLSLVSNTAQVEYGVPVLLKVILVFPMVGAVLGIGVLIFLFLAWKRKYWTIYGRLHYSLILLSGLVFLWVLNYWNLLGWKL
jgi:CubicO group peptidase (beta-lactamase class C family)